MTVKLTKGANLSLSQAADNLRVVRVGLGWAARETSGESFDLDASAFLLAESGKVRQDEDFIFYGNLQSRCGSVQHSGDDLEGGSGEDDEVITVRLEQVPPAIQKVSFTVSIYEADKRRQNFGMVTDAFIRVINDENDVELARFDLSEDMSTETAMIFGEIYRHKGEWKFRAVGQGYVGGLGPLARHFGVDVEEE
jgi:tellurium resistance protein TerD